MTKPRLEQVTNTLRGKEFYQLSNHELRIICHELLDEVEHRRDFIKELENKIMELIIRVDKLEE